MERVKQTDFKTKKINELTGGKIADFPMPSTSNEVLENMFLTNNGEFIGDFDMGWCYVRKELKVCNDYPHGVAEVYKFDKLIGYLGYTHRGGQLFIIGDRLFDENYLPKKEDYPVEQWRKWEEKYNKNLEEDPMLVDGGIADVIPFIMRGGKLIENMEECKQAAINLSKYLS